MIDFRSDTVTRPSQEMLEAMFKAPVGDDVYREDPSVRKLESYVANFFSKQAALFCPSGTMTNQISLFLHSGPMQEIITEKSSHIYFYETGGVSMHSRSSMNLIEGSRGKITAKQVEMALNPKDIHRPQSSVVSIENTTNKGGGACYNLDEIDELYKLCQKKSLKFHLDGARVWNALVKEKMSGEDLGKPFDSISVCLSKGLGAPVGSLIVGSEEFIEKARRVRKVMGGGMRQVGHLAAAGMYALEYNFPRLYEDHKKAQEISHALEKLEWVKKILPVETNIVIFEIDFTKLDQIKDAHELIEKLKGENILANALDLKSIRFVTHLDIKKEGLEKLKKALLNVS